MFHVTSKCVSVCVVLTLVSLSTCANKTDKTTPDQMEQEKTKESHDVEVLDIMSIMNDCNETFRTEMSYVESLNKTGSFPDETDKTAKCFVRCLLEKSGVMSAEGEVDRLRAPAFFTTAGASVTGDDYRNSTDACSDRNETCSCEKSYQFVKCVVNMELNKYEY